MTVNFIYLPGIYLFIYLFIYLCIFSHIADVNPLLDSHNFIKTTVVEVNILFWGFCIRFYIYTNKWNLL